MQLETVDGDLLNQDVDVIVNAWNRNIIPWWLLLPQGVSGAIKKRGGYAPFRELGKLGPIPLGGAVITGAGKLPFKSIIHVADISMWWRSSARSPDSPWVRWWRCWFSPDARTARWPRFLPVANRMPRQFGWQECFVWRHG